MRHLRYGWYVLRHKWFVFLAACRLGIPWLGLIHDLSKFNPDEWVPYANFFYGPKAKKVRDETGYYKPTDTGKPDFDFAWLLHQKRNRHHWQWWTLVYDDPCTCATSSHLVSSTGLITEASRCEPTNTSQDPSSASGAGSSAHWRTSLTLQGNTGFSAKGIGMSTVESNEKSGGTISERMIERGTPEIPKQPASALGLRANAGDRQFCNTMGGNIPVAPAAEKTGPSFCVLTTSTAGELGTATRCSREGTEQSTNGSLTTNSQKASAFSATTATQRSAITDTALTETCSICGKPRSQLKVLEMPMRYCKEMLADWRGAGRAQGTPDTLAWYYKNGQKMRLGPETRRWIEEQLTEGMR